MENDSDVGVAPVPQALDTGQRNWASFWMYAVPANAANPASAWDFIAHMTTPEQEKVLYSEQIKLRMFGSPYAHKSLKDNLGSNPFIYPVLKSADNAKSAEIAGRSGNKNQTNVLKEAVNSVLLGVADSKEALTKAKQSFSKQ
jgi:ABC-type glycerol-3-phosphate transport system substrate-binding protein